MTRLYRCVDAVVTATVCTLAVLACCPLLVLDGAQSVLHKLGVRG